MQIKSTAYSSPYLCDPSTTACFSGHRPEKMSHIIGSTVGMQAFKSIVYLHVHEAYEAGYRTFITGMARGFDIIAAQVVLDYKRRFSVRENIRLIAVSPFADEILNRHDNDLYDYNSVLEACDDVIYVRRDYHKSCFHVRNRFMVDNSSLLISACLDEKSGTGSTIKYARKKGLRVDNIALGVFGDMSDMHYEIPEVMIFNEHRKGTVTYVNLPHPFSPSNDTQDNEKKQ